MIESSKDILFLALTVAVVILTFFFAWFLYYLVSIIRQAHSMMKDVSASLAKLHAILDTLKDTISRSTSHLGLIVEAVKQLTGLYLRRKKRGSTEDGEKTKREKTG
jgi:predicted PurR-regulated permease PerM